MNICICNVHNAIYYTSNISLYSIQHQKTPFDGGRCLEPMHKLQVLLKLQCLAGFWELPRKNVQISLEFFLLGCFVMKSLLLFNFTGLGGQFKIHRNEKTAWDKLPPVNTAGLLGDHASTICSEKPFSMLKQVINFALLYKVLCS